MKRVTRGDPGGGPAPPATPTYWPAGEPGSTLWGLQPIPRLHTTEQLNTALAGRYTIEGRVGEGGMATVYLARDVRHNRKVALKVLKPDLGAIVGVERFLSEIEVTANLQHPNLLPLFDSGAAEGLLYYVMPYVEGESLRARLDREKQLPVEESLRIATAVANALDYAHRRGVIHRDLKPENILLHDGQPLVADFGIALAVSNAGGDRVTQTGLSLGTPRYMSPEQATGDRAIDARTDIYSLGAVTYEMLTGDPPHTGSSSQAIIARVLTERPRSIRSSRPNVPPHVEATVDRALEKLAADRFDSAREFADALAGKVAIATTAARAVDTHPRRGRTPLERAFIAALTATSLIALALAGLTLNGEGTVPAPPETRFDFETPAATGPLQISMSPDGRTILFAGGIGGGRNAIWARPLNSAEAGPVSATIGAAGYTFWSPDSRQFAFALDEKLRRISLSGGAAETISDVPGPFRGGTWNADNVIVFAVEGDLFRVSATGGIPTRLSLVNPDSMNWEWPWFLPNGKQFLVLGRARGIRHLYVASLDGGAPVRVTEMRTRAAFSPPDLLLFVRDEALYAQRLDMKRFQTVGEPVRIIDDVGANPANGSTGIGVSNVGALVKRAVTTAERRLQPHWFSRDGAKLGAIGEPQLVREMALSPDGKRIAFTTSSARIATRPIDIWIIDVASGVTSLLVSRTDGIDGVLWSPDSRSIVYRTVSATGHDSTLLRRIGGGNVDSVLHIATTPTRAEDFIADGRSLLLRETGRIFSKDLGGTGDTTGLAQFAEGIDEIRISPDARIVAYNTNETGMWQVWVASFPSFQNRRQVSPAGGAQARWRGDGRELFYLTLQGKVMAASLIPGPEPEFSAPKELFQSPLRVVSGILDQYDVTKDGQRFLFGVPPDGADEQIPRLTVLINWTSALEKN